jgi:hypothetical protein
MRQSFGLLLGASLLLSVPAHAAVITLNGSDFDVRYDDTLVGLFGQPTLSGNGRTIVFTPTGFSAQSTGTTGTVFRNDSVTFDLLPRAGKRVATVQVLEAGDYKVVKRSTSPLDPAVDVSGEIRLTNLFDGVSFVNGQLVKSAPLNVVCPTSSCATTPWTAAAILAAPLSWSDGSSPASPDLGAPIIRFFLEDLLTAESFAIGDSAFIQKKQVSNTITIDVDIDQVPVPLPAALPLLISALGGMVTVARRRSAESTPPA